jgi:hypothetical protein
MVMIDQIPWHELNVNDELTLRCTDGFCREYETRLRRTIYSWRHMRADMVVHPVIEIDKAIRNTGFGIEVDEERAVLDPQNSVVGHAYNDQLKTDDDLEKIHTPVIKLDKEATSQAEAAGHEIFDGILEVLMQGRSLMFAPWDAIVTWHGVEPTLMDLAVRPDFIHRMMKRITDGYLKMLDQFEEQGLLAYPQQRIHCTGAYTDELPAKGFDPKKPRAKDVWTFGQAQIFVSVSPAMHKEFDIDYAVKWYKHFGLGYYGCCEPLDGKIDIIRALPKVRKISMSPWVDVEKGASRIGRDYVFSRKPSPAQLAWDSWQPKAVEQDLRKTAEACKRHGCPLEFILKDISTVRYEPQRLWQWSDIAMRVAKEFSV